MKVPDARFMYAITIIVLVTPLALVGLVAAMLWGGITFGWSLAGELRIKSLEYLGQDAS